MLSLLLACTNPASVTISGFDSEESRGVPSGGTTADSGIETVEGTGTGATDTTTTPDPDEDPDSARVFNLNVVHAVDLRISNEGMNALQRDGTEFVSADLSWDGEALPNIGVHIKGRLGSLRDMNGKAAFKVDLLEFGEKRKLEGLEKLNLNNMVQDGSQLKELAAYATYREAAGIPAPRVAYAWVTVNGEDFGLYSVVEEYDDEFLQRAYADPSGNLYDGDYYLYANGSYDLVDFIPETQDRMALDEGSAVDLADVHAVTDSVRASVGSDRFYRELGAYVDMAQFTKFWAVTSWIGQYDSYCYYSNNYRVYFNPETHELRNRRQIDRKVRGDLTT